MLGALLVLAARASTHSALMGSDPKKGATVDSAPAQIRFTVSEEINPDFITTTVAVGSGKGQKVDATPTRRLVTLAVPDAVRTAGEGKKWTAVFRVVPSDGHPISAEVGFRVAAAPAPAAPTTTAAVPTTAPPAPTTIAAGATSDSSDSLGTSPS